MYGKFNLYLKKINGKNIWIKECYCPLTGISYEKEKDSGKIISINGKLL